MSSFVIDDYRLDITPQGNYPVVYLSQFEDGRDIRFYMLNRGRSFTIPTGISAFVSGLKSNGGYYEHLCTIDGNYVIMPVEADMTDVSGRGLANIKLTNQSGDTVISAKFVVNVQESVSDSGIEVPTVAETIFQQLLDEIRQYAAGLNLNIDQFKQDINDEVDTFESGINSDIDAIDARMNTFIAQHSGVSANSTKRVETVLFESDIPVFGDVNLSDESGDSYAFSLSGSLDSYDYIEIKYSAFGDTGIVRCKPSDIKNTDGNAFHWSGIQYTSQRNSDGSSGLTRTAFRQIEFQMRRVLYQQRQVWVDARVWAWTGSVSTTGDIADSFVISWDSTENVAVSSGYTAGIYSITGIKYNDVTASKDTELTDIRVSADGTVYTTAGAAVRALENRVDDQSIEISGTTLYIGGSV